MGRCGATVRRRASARTVLVVLHLVKGRGLKRLHSGRPLVGGRPSARGGRRLGLRRLVRQARAELRREDLAVGKQVVVGGLILE